jgi:hypothetical protein
MLGSAIDGARAAAATVDRRFAIWTVVSAAVALLAFGILTAIIPTPFFVRPIAPEPFAIAVWIASAPLIGIVAATYLAPAPNPAATAPAVPLGGSDGGAAGSGDRGSTLGSLGGLAAFLAIGCPVCNKIALVLLGTSGALSIYAPIQPLIGGVSLILLGGTMVWRLRLRARGTLCEVPAGR